MDDEDGRRGRAAHCAVNRLAVDNRCSFPPAVRLPRQADAAEVPCKRPDVERRGLGIHLPVTFLSTVASRLKSMGRHVPRLSVNKLATATD